MGARLCPAAVIGAALRDAVGVVDHDVDGRLDVITVGDRVVNGFEPAYRVVARVEVPRVALVCRVADATVAHRGHDSTPEVIEPVERHIRIGTVGAPLLGVLVREGSDAIASFAHTGIIAGIRADVTL